MRILTTAFVLLFCEACAAQSGENVAGSPQANAEDRLLFPHNFLRGYADFAVAPPHNEPDLGLCPQHPAPLVPGVQTCGAYARYVFGGYVEFQPFGRTALKRFFLFGTPRVWAGDNVPMMQYTASAAGILWEETMGAGVTLPFGLELRATYHRDDRLGRYSGARNPLVASPDGPYGMYTTIGVRWYFGGYGRQGGSY